MPSSAAAQIVPVAAGPDCFRVNPIGGFNINLHSKGDRRQERPTGAQINSGLRSNERRVRLCGAERPISNSIRGDRQRDIASNALE